MGLPGRRDEYWRYTDPPTLNAPRRPAAPVFDDGERPVFEGVDRLRSFSWTVSSMRPRPRPALAGVEIERLSDALRAISTGRASLWRAGGAGQKPVARPFAALNTAFATDGM